MTSEELFQVETLQLLALLLGTLRVPSIDASDIDENGGDCAAEESKGAANFSSDVSTCSHSSLAQAQVNGNTTAKLGMQTTRCRAGENVFRTISYHSIF
ncbi:hypothetical protein IV203_031742 [Nitzschia inconspicua]|uniref:Secreted protein n=1 Tax=Nitzschia inconspicua TaxID=303405 RepID=A0A9K3Q5C7_9STRA|nr:hypothetical protein IV203_031742 [Nitzschia inconspicua]